MASSWYMNRSMLYMLVAFSVYISVAVSTLATSNGTLRVPVTFASAEDLDPVATNSTLLSKKGLTKVEIDSTFLIGTIKLGEEPFEVIFDSGSRALWVFGKDVNKDFFARENPKFNHHFYDETTSRTFRPYSTDPDDPAMCASERYEDRCSTEGKLGFEKLTVGDIVVSDTRLQVTHTLRGPETQFTLYDGMFGLGFEPRSSRNKAPVCPFTKMVEDGLLNLKMFSVYKGEDSGKGEIVFGGYDSKRFYNPAEMVAVKAIGDGTFIDWVINVYDLGVGELGTTHNFYAYVDTGTSTIVLPKPFLESLPRTPPYDLLLDTIFGKDASDTPGFLECQSRNTLPSLHFGIGTRTYSMGGEDYTAAPGGKLSFSHDGVEYCALLVRANVNENPSKITLGTPFMQKYYTMFFYDYEDSGKPMIGFAEARHTNEHRHHHTKEEDYFPSFWCGLSSCVGPLFQSYEDDSYAFGGN